MIAAVVIGFAVLAVAGAWIRVGATVALNRWPLPLGTLSVNLAGSLLAGVLVSHLQGDGRTVLVTGGLGAMTTFSSFAAEVRAMGADRRWALAAGYAVVTAVGAVAAARLGLGL